MKVLPRIFRDNIRLLTGVPFALLYGTIARMVFRQGAPEDSFVTLSLAFLFLVPLAVGALTIWWSPEPDRRQWRSAIFVPWWACGIAALIVWLFFIEALICVLMALPILLLMSSLGGLTMCAFLRRRAGRGSGTMLGILLLAPYLVAPLEGQFALSDQWNTVETQIEIQADAATVWANLIAVPTIQPAERTASLLFDLLGAPRPLAATLNYAGVGGIRRGLFTGNLAFIETITHWEPERQIVWSIRADTSQVTQAPWGEIGGRYFDVTAASYRVEPLGAGRVRLSLDSTHRLSTRLNGYGALWTRWGLSEFQQQVLQIIKTRSEEVPTRLPVP